MNSGHINEVRRRRYFENKQDILKRKQSTPRKLKGPKPRTAAQAIADKEAGREEGQRPHAGQDSTARATTNNNSKKSVLCVEYSVDLKRKFRLLLLNHASV